MSSPTEICFQKKLLHHCFILDPITPFSVDIGFLVIIALYKFLKFLVGFPADSNGWNSFWIKFLVT